MFKSNSILSYVRELSVVIIGVTVAFFIGSLSQSIQRDELKSNILSAIKNEQLINIRRIDQTIKNNKLMLLEYERFIRSKNNPGKNNSDTLKIIININVCIFNDTGFDLAVQGDILSDMDFELLKDISWCYSLQSSSKEMQDEYRAYLGSKTAGRDIAFYRTAINKLNNINSDYEYLRNSSQELVDNIEVK